MNVPALAKPVPRLDRFVDSLELSSLLTRAMQEDMGSIDRDVTTACMLTHARRAEALLCARQPGRLSGSVLLPTIAHVYDRRIHVDTLLSDSAELNRGSIVARLSGPLCSLLAIERVALNFLCHMSGVATLTASYVEAIAGTSAELFDTRKVLPGMRRLQKYAVVCGGGKSHRFGLYDAVLIKDNHIAHLSLEQLSAALRAAFDRARSIRPAPSFVEVEVDTLQQFEVVLACKPDLVLLDNMTTGQMRKAVEIRNRAGLRVPLEASGGINLENVREIAMTGVDRVAVGRITHSAPALDMGMDIE